MIERLSIGTLAAAILPTIIATGCATTANPTPEVSGVTPHSISINGTVEETESDANAAQIRVLGSPLTTMSVLMQVYKELNIPIGTMNTTAGLVGNSSLAVPSHKLAGKSISSYLYCGQESMLGLRTDLDDVIVSILSTAVKAGDSATVVTTELKGWARPTGNSSNAVPCESNGTLEHQINIRVASALAAGA
jgi:hypothetical protein